MSTFRFDSLAEAGKAIERDMASRERRLGRAVQKTARQTRNLVVRGLVPRAFGELSSSIEAVDVGPGASNVVADAPYAEAVELGSRPHTPPLAPLIAWVQLRGMQGITAKGGVIRNQTRGVATVKNVRLEAAKSIATMLHERLGGNQAAAAWRESLKDRSLSNSRAARADAADTANADPAVIAVARAIQAKIKASGTKPTRFMFRAIPSAVEYLDGFVKAALPETRGGVD